MFFAGAPPAFTEDGKHLVSNDESRLIWQVPAGEPPAPVPYSPSVRWLGFSRDGRFLVTGGAQLVQVWDVAAGRTIGTPSRLPAAVQRLAVDPTGRHLAVACADEKVRLLELASGREIGAQLPHVVSGHRGWEVESGIVFSPDGRWLVTMVSGRAGQIWEVPSGKPAGACPGGCNCADFHPGGRMLITGGFGGRGPEVQLWEVPFGKRVGNGRPQIANIRAVACSPDGKSYAATYGSSVVIYQTDTGAPVGRALVHDGYIFAVAYSPDGKILATAGRDCRLWSVASGQPISPPFVGRGPFRGLVFSPDGKNVAALGSDESPHWIRVPTPIPGTKEQIRLWTQIVLGKGFDAAGKSVYLRARNRDGVGDWSERLAELAAAGGPPLP
jgi:WD40 repeat protein